MAWILIYQKYTKNILKFMNIEYFKITNETENHHGFQYKDGLNVLDRPFEASGRCVKGGLYFTTRSYIDKYYLYGINIRRIILPRSEPGFQMVLDPDGDKWRANKIIFGEKYDLLDPLTYQILNLDITKNKYFVDFASKYGRIDSLNWWLESKLNLHYSDNAMIYASMCNKIIVLDWWLKQSKNLDNPLDLKYTGFAIDLARFHKNEDVLLWWINSGIKIKN